MLFRLLRHIYGAGTLRTSRNITDVDDKINARAARNFPDLPLNQAIRRSRRRPRAVPRRYCSTRLLPPTFEPRATEYIRRDDGREDMISLIEALVKRGNAYVAEGHVLFDVRRCPTMAAFQPLARRDGGRRPRRGRALQAATRWTSSCGSRRSPASRPGRRPGASTPGRPGWHIECSAMAGALSATTFDIHGGGIDLIFPHHENEIAQSRCAHGTPVMANVWIHNGFLQVEGEKMSKSLGNFVTIHDCWPSMGHVRNQNWHGRVIRLAMLPLMTHYRPSIGWR